MLNPHTHSLYALLYTPLLHSHSYSYPASNPNPNDTPNKLLVSQLSTPLNQGLCSTTHDHDWLTLKHKALDTFLLPFFYHPYPYSLTLLVVSSFSLTLPTALPSLATIPPTQQHTNSHSVITSFESPPSFPLIAPFLLSYNPKPNYNIAYSCIPAT